MEHASFEALKGAAEQLNLILMTGAGVAFSVILGRILCDSEGKVDVLGWKIPMTKARVVLMVLTSLHIYYATSLILEVSNVLLCGDQKYAADAWEVLTRSNSDKLRVFFEMQKRSPQCIGAFCMSVPADAIPLDLVFFLHIGLAIAVFFATVSWSKSGTTITQARLIIAACALVLLNWWAGTQWAIVVSDLKNFGDGLPVLSSRTTQLAKSYLGAHCYTREKQ